MKSKGYSIGRCEVWMLGCVTPSCLGRTFMDHGSLNAENCRQYPHSAAADDSG
jgi:hypothetical protein